jgi:hypothetical protein
MVSNCGFSGNFTVVNLPCGVTSLVASDQGYLYAELRDEAGNLFEGGIFDPQNDSSLNPYLSASLHLPLTNASARYACGNDLFIGTGLIPTGSSTPMYMALLGNASNWSSSLAFQPSYSLTITNAAYIFQADSNITATPGTDPVGVPTACTGCSITKVTSIAQPRGSENLSDGSVFGVDPESYEPSIFWEDIRLGEWQEGSNLSSSTLVYSTNSGAWYAGEENYPNSEVAFAEVDPTAVAYQSYDGISLTSGASMTKHKRPASAFTMPTPPTCTLDGHGYCVATTLDSGGTMPGADCGSPDPSIGISRTIYQIRDTKAVLTPYEYVVVHGGPECPPRWIPSNPATSLNDPNLP